MKKTIQYRLIKIRFAFSQLFEISILGESHNYTLKIIWIFICIVLILIQIFFFGALHILTPYLALFFIVPFTFLASLYIISKINDTLE